jgi:predicted phosphoadenosine phosphosulfate sulfurtransferase
MSSGYWQTARQRDLLPSGKLITERVAQYIATWEKRCYSGGIPDDAPRKLRAANRVPSYRSIAVAILSNDHQLTSLGFQPRASAILDALLELKSEGAEKAHSTQRDLWES